MLDILKMHLSECFAVEEATLIEQAIQELALMNVDSDEQYSNLFMEWEDDLVDDLNGSIRSFVMLDCMNALTAHGIFLNEDAKLPHYINILRFINMIDDYENPQSLLDVATNEEIDAPERFAMMVEELTGEAADNILAVVDSISSSFCPSTAEVLARMIAAMPIDTAEEVENRALGKALEVYATKINGKNMQCYKHVHEANAAVGLPLELYWKTYNAYLLSIPEDAMLYELIGFALISDRSADNPADVIAPILSTYFGDDIDKIAIAKSKINQAIIDIKGELNSGVFVTRPE